MRVNHVVLALISVLAASTAYAADKPSVHVVQPGQKLAAIAKRYNISLDELCQANGLHKNSKIHPGQRLNLSDSGSDGGAKVDSPLQPVAWSGSFRDKAQGSSSAKHGAASLAAARYEAPPKKKGAVHVIGYHGDWQGPLVDRKSHIVTKSAVSVSRILAWPHKDFRMNDRLLTLLAQVSDHFGGRPLRVVSGYRTTSWVEESKHPLGRACDFVVLGVPNTVLRDYLRTLDSVGVGYYPNSTFVHLDVRDKNTYWVDYAGPGEPPRLTPTAVIPKDPAASADLQSELASANQGESELETAPVPPSPPAEKAEPVQEEHAKAEGYALRRNVPAAPLH